MCGKLGGSTGEAGRIGTGRLPLPHPRASTPLLCHTRKCRMPPPPVVQVSQSNVWSCSSPFLPPQDHYLNAANWMWLSASAFFNQYFRVYSPITFGKKYDKDGKFIRK